MPRKLLRTLSLLLIVSFFQSQNLYAFGSTPLTTGGSTPLTASAPVFNPSIISNPSPVIVQNQNSSHSKVLAQYGVTKLGDSLGLDPRLSNLIGAPISGITGSLTGSGTTIVDSINTGILRGATSLGIEYLTAKANLDPLLASLTSRAITGAIAGAIDPKQNIFEGVFNAFKESALNIARLGVSGNDPWSQAQYLQRVTNFSDIIKRDGLAKAIENSATQILHEDSISSILKSTNPITSVLFKSVGEFVGFLTSGNVFADPAKQGSLLSVKKEGKNFNRIQLSNGDWVDLDEGKLNIDEFKVGGKVLRGEFGVDERGNFGLITGVVTGYESTGRIQSKSIFKDGQNTEVQIGFGEDGQDVNPKFVIAGHEGQAGIIYDDKGNLKDAEVWGIDGGYTYSLRDGQIESLSQTGFGIDIDSGNLVMNNEYLYVMKRESDGSYKSEVQYSSVGSEGPIIIDSMKNVKVAIEAKHGTNIDPQGGLWKEVTAEAVLGIIDRSIIVLRGKSILLGTMLKPLYQKGTLQGKIARGAGLVGTTVAVLDVAGNIWKTSNDPRLGYGEKVTLNIMHEVSAGATFGAGVIGGAIGVRTGNIAIAIGGTALFGGSVARISDVLTEGVKEYFYSN